MADGMVCGMVMALTLAGVTPAAGQESVTGTWSATYDADLRTNPDGTHTVRSRREATLVLEERDGALAGSWTWAGGEKRSVTGTRAGDHLEFGTGWYTIEQGGTTHRIRQLWEATRSGDELRGTIRMEWDGPRELPERRWEARRARGGRLP